MAIRKAKSKVQPKVNTEMIYGATNVKELKFDTYSTITSNIKDATDVSIEFISDKNIKNSLINYVTNKSNNKLVCSYDESKAYGVVIANGRIVSSRILNMSESTEGNESFISFDYIENNEVKTKKIQYTQNAAIAAASGSGSSSTISIQPGTESGTDTNNLVKVTVGTNYGKVIKVEVDTNNIAQKNDIDTLQYSINNIYNEINELKKDGDAVNKAGTDSENNLTLSIIQSPNKSITEINPVIRYASYNTTSKTLSDGILTNSGVSPYINDIITPINISINDISIQLPNIKRDLNDISTNKIPQLTELVNSFDVSIKNHETRITSLETTVGNNVKRIEDTSQKTIDVSNALDNLIDKVNKFSHHSHNKISGNDNYVSISIDKTTDGNLSSTATISTTTANVNIGTITDTKGTVTYAGTPGTGLTTASEIKTALQTAITNFYKHTVDNKKYVPTAKIASDATLTTESYSYSNGNITLNNSNGKQTYKVTMNKVNPFETDHGTSSTSQIQTVSISVIDEILNIIKTLDDRITALENTGPITAPTTTEYTPVFLTLD